MSSLEIRPATAADLPSITEIYEHAVRFGTATFELIPPDLAEMTRRFGTLMGWRLPLCRRSGSKAAWSDTPMPALTVRAGLPVHGGEFGLFATCHPPAGNRATVAATADRRMRGARLPPDDRRDRRFRQRRIDWRSFKVRI